MRRGRIFLILLFFANRKNLFISLAVGNNIAGLFYIAILTQAVYYAACAPVVACDNLALYNLPYVFFEMV